MPSFYEFFAGGGMVREALGAEWKCLFANDFDAKKGQAYRSNFGGKELHVGDVAEVELDQLPGSADLVWASFPCQDLSLAGNGAGLRGGRSGTFWGFWKLVQGLAKQGRKPAIVALENVYGLLTSNGGDDFRTLCDAVAAEGYWIGAAVIDASHFVPQSRPRLFIVAVDQRIDVRGQSSDAPPVSPFFPSRLVQAREQLSERASSAWRWWTVGQPGLRNTGLADLIEEPAVGVEWHSEEQTQRLLSLMNKRHLERVAAAKAAKSLKVGTVYKRTRPTPEGEREQRAEVRFDDVAGCLRTPGGGSSRQTVLIVHGDEVRSRLLSPRETARLMGLPDTYRLPERYNEAYHLTGDGVVVPVVRHLAQQLFQPILSACISDEEAA